MLIILNIFNILFQRVLSTDNILPTTSLGLIEVR